jgi:hypothetical protein
MSFRDFGRSLTVSGNFPDQIDAVFSAMRDDIQRLSTPFGGSGHRFLLGYFTLIILATALIVLTAIFFENRRKSILLPIFLVGLLFILFFVLPLGDMFAGFVAVSGDASFVVWYGPQISFWGFVIGAVALSLTLVPVFHEKKLKPDVAKVKIKKRTLKNHERS